MIEAPIVQYHQHGGGFILHWIPCGIVTMLISFILLHIHLFRDGTIKAQVIAVVKCHIVFQ